MSKLMSTVNFIKKASSKLIGGAVGAGIGLILGPFSLPTGLFFHDLEDERQRDVINGTESKWEKFLRFTNNSLLYVPLTLAVLAPVGLIIGSVKGAISGFENGSSFVFSKDIFLHFFTFEPDNESSVRKTINAYKQDFPNESDPRIRLESALNKFKKESWLSLDTIIKKIHDDPTYAETFFTPNEKAEIKRLEEAKAKEQAKEGIVTNSHNLFKSRLSEVKRLPPEIAYKIVTFMSEDTQVLSPQEINSASNKGYDLATQAEQSPVPQQQAGYPQQPSLFNRFVGWFSIFKQNHTPREESQRQAPRVLHLERPKQPSVS